MQFFNVARNFIRPGYGRVIASKLVARIQNKGSRQREKIVRWCIEHERDVGVWATEINSDLWQEAEGFRREQTEAAHSRLSALGVTLGGAGATNLLFFLTRMLRPNVVVETGVAAGFSSQAFLSAMERNGGGILYSSDFPYFRLANPEKYVGILVEKSLKRDWRLFTNGDRENLPQILSECRDIDLFHYDSDKTYSGREFAMGQIEAKLAERSVLIFDDIQDNWHFRDIAHQSGKQYLVFRFDSKWVGLLGGDPSLHC